MLSRCSVISNATLVHGSCSHLTFPAIGKDPLSWHRSVLKAPSKGDIIHFYL